LGGVAIKVIDLNSGKCLFSLEKLLEKNFIFKDFIVLENGLKILFFYSNHLKNKTIIELWEIKSGEKIKIYDKYEYNHIEIDEKNNRFFTWGYSNILTIWDLKTGEIIKSLNGWSSTKHIKGIDKNTIASSSNHKNIYLWNIEKAKNDHREINQKGLFYVIKSYKNELVASVTSNKTIKVVDLKSFEVIMESEKQTSLINDLVFFTANDKIFLISVSGTHFGKKENVIKIWDVEKGICEKKLYGHSSQINRVKVIQNNTKAITISDDFTAILWDLKSGQEIFNFRHTINYNGHSILKSLVIFDNEKKMITGGGDGLIKVWNLKNGNLDLTLPISKKPITNIKISKFDKNLILTTSEDSSGVITNLWNLNKLNCLSSFKGASQYVANAKILYIPYKFNSDLRKFNESLLINNDLKGSHILLISPENTLKVCDIITEDILFVLKKHKEQIIETYIITNKLMFISISSNGMIIIWNLLNGKEISSLSIGRPISKTELTDNEKTLIIGESNGQIHFIKIQDTKIPTMRIV
jgi:WD40 repeat protein